MIYSMWTNRTVFVRPVMTYLRLTKDKYILVLDSVAFFLVNDLFLALLLLIYVERFGEYCFFGQKRLFFFFSSVQQRF